MEDNLNPRGEFFQRLGHRVIQSQSASWCEIQPRVLLSFPNYKLIEPSEAEINDLVRTYKLQAIRYPTTINNFGFLSTVAVNTNSDYDLSCLHQKARNQTRRGLENSSVEEIDFEYLEKNGLVLNKETAERQGRESEFSNPAYWKKYCEAAQATSGFSAWGAFIDGQLAAFLIASEVDDWVEWLVNHSSSAMRNKYPNNALAFNAARYFLQEKGCKGICYGLGSLEPTSTLDRFKRRMGWNLEPIKQRLVFSTKMRWIFSLAQEPFLRVLNKSFSKSYTVRKTSAMIRLYRQQTYDAPTSDIS